MTHCGRTAHSRKPVAPAARVLGFLLLSSVYSFSAGQRSYFTISRGTSSRNRVLSDEDGSLLDSLQRGQEGLLAQLEQLSNAIKEDELKLNNVFYKLGRHDTDISSTTSQQVSLQNTARKLENKLNRQSFNMEFLRRHVTELKKGVDTGTTTTSTVGALQLTVDSLQKALVQALYRTEQLENKTRLLERNLHSSNAVADIDENNIYYASRSPKTTYYYLDSEALEGVCDESSGWVSVTNGGCWWVSTTTASFAQAVAGCAKQGGMLAQLPMDDRDWPVPVKRKFTDLGTQTLHWTCGTSVFDGKTWEYLFSGSGIPSEHWTDGFAPTSSVSRHCAAMSPSGLMAVSCAMRNHFVCEKL
ncbi:C-type lectin fold [Trinorchestia longiramus]|nr:C-type lectin fold [Trinorchestia longiramus]